MGDLLPFSFKGGEAARNPKFCHRAFFYFGTTMNGVFKAGTGAALDMSDPWIFRGGGVWGICECVEMALRDDEGLEGSLLLLEEDWRSIGVLRQETRAATDKTDTTTTVGRAKKRQKIKLKYIRRTVFQ